MAAKKKTETTKEEVIEVTEEPKKEKNWLRKTIGKIKIGVKEHAPAVGGTVTTIYFGTKIIEKVVNCFKGSEE